MKCQNTWIIFLICIFKLNTAQAPHHLELLIIRNIGQGQWVTHISNDFCDHYDFGGEIYYLKYQRKIFSRSCSKKKNRLYLSHADKDHYAFLPFIKKNSSKLCWAYRSIDLIENFPQIPWCAEQSQIKLIFYDSSGKNKNDRSLVFILSHFLIPGDSGQKTEKKWIPTSEKNLDSINFLILGHHGSKNSTSHLLLKRLPKLKMALASARYARFKHPHHDTLKRLKQHKIPLLKTEEWGNIIFDRSY